VQPDGGTHFRVWAPRPREVSLVIERVNGVTQEVRPEREANGYHSVLVPGVGAGDRYRYRLDGQLFADPASRAQPEGPFGPSEIVDSQRYAWGDGSWRGVTLPGQILYEIHVGTFTPEGTWRAAAEHLGDLALAGITTIEVMPVSEFPGRFGWGYDGVFPYAPTRLYGSPDDFRAFIDRAHAAGLGVILDVVYNHLGPSGCVFGEYSESYFARHYKNEWGDGLHFDGPCSAPVREYFIWNAYYWIDEFHLDGLRLDATQSIHDFSDEHVIAAVGKQARKAARDRSIIVITENETQDTRMLRPLSEGGYGLDAAWNDDFHHSAIVATTGRCEAYYSDHRGTPQEFISTAKYGYLYQGQRYAWQKRPRGRRTDGLSPAAFVTFIENHDQVANFGDGSRLHARTTPGRYRAITALLLLLPGTPMLFQGQEFGATSPFLFFADHESDLATAVQQGRGEFLAQFPSMASPEAQARVPLANDPATFERCKLRWEERERHLTHRRLHEALIALRRSEAAFRQQVPGAVDGAVLANEAFVLRYKTALAQDERILIVNLGADLDAGSFAEPLMAAPGGCAWTVRWSSEHPDYGGFGVPEIVTDEGWRIPGHSATVLAPAPRDVGAGFPGPREVAGSRPVENNDGGTRTD
jgi:maltooligosyltrehalose trehalohydrolase